MRGSGTAWTDLRRRQLFHQVHRQEWHCAERNIRQRSAHVDGLPRRRCLHRFPRHRAQGRDLRRRYHLDYTGGLYVTIADLRVEAGGNAGPIAVQIAGDNWRIVNNELSAASATNTAHAAGINGNATNAFWYGNHIHDIGGGARRKITASTSTATVRTTSPTTSSRRHRRQRIPDLRQRRQRFGFRQPRPFPSQSGARRVQARPQHRRQRAQRHRAVEQHRQQHRLFRIRFNANTLHGAHRTTTRSTASIPQARS